jgi:hypothetical protein
MAYELLPLVSREQTPRERCVHTALILDDDLAFMLWLGLALDAAGFGSVPAKSVRFARALLRRMGEPVGLIIFNPALPGVERFLQNLCSQNPSLKTIAAIPAEEEEAEVPAFVAARLRKPATLDDQAKLEWVGAIRRVSGGGGAVPAR